MANNKLTLKLVYSTFEKPISLRNCLHEKHNIYEKRHLELEGKSVTIVSDGFVDKDKEIQAELKNAGLQNILKLQEMRYGTLDNAIARADERGVYADVSNIPDGVGARAEYVANAQAELKRLASELGLTPEEVSKLTGDQIAARYQELSAAAQSGTSQEGGAK